LNRALAQSIYSSTDFTPRKKKPHLKNVDNIKRSWLEPSKAPCRSAVQMCPSPMATQASVFIFESFKFLNMVASRYANLSPQIASPLYKMQVAVVFPCPGLKKWLLSDPCALGFIRSRCMSTVEKVSGVECAHAQDSILKQEQPTSSKTRASQMQGTPVLLHQLALMPC
jgi:hypothetical protein